MAAEDPDEHAIGYQVLPRGTPVEAADGAQVGTFHRALHHGRENLFDGMVIRTEEGKRFVDAPEVARITNKRVTLTIDSAAARELPEPHGALDRLQQGAQRRARRWRRRLPGG
ncbi:MAG TPA: hypothetical protein VHF89_13645 [Solirubrobacteraceae bacterium]|nr:hypothetical protein [Solirubrobacteraceae bacterium]